MKIENSVVLVTGANGGVLRQEFDVNCLGVMRMCREFAPVFASTGGGVIVNMEREEVYPGEQAKQVVAQLRTDPKGVENMAGFLPGKSLASKHA